MSQFAVFIQALAAAAALAMVYDLEDCHKTIPRTDHMDSLQEDRERHIYHPALSSLDDICVYPFLCFSCTNPGTNEGRLHVAGLTWTNILSLVLPSRYGSFRSNSNGSDRSIEK